MCTTWTCTLGTPCAVGLRSLHPVPPRERGLRRNSRTAILSRFGSQWTDGAGRTDAAGPVRDAMGRYNGQLLGPRGPQVRHPARALRRDRPHLAGRRRQHGGVSLGDTQALMAEPPPWPASVDHYEREHCYEFREIRSHRSDGVCSRDRPDRGWQLDTGRDPDDRALPFSLRNSRARGRTRRAAKPALASGRQGRRRAVPPPADLRRWHGPADVADPAIATSRSTRPLPTKIGNSARIIGGNCAVSSTWH